MYIMHRNVPQLGWEMLHYGIKDSSSYIGPVWAQTIVDW